MTQTRKTASSLVAVASALTMITGCGTGPAGSTRFADPRPFGGGTARTFVDADADGRPTRIGIRMSASVLDRLAEDGGDPRNVAMLAVPRDSGTPFDHVMANWNPHGHPPEGVFDKPHFDVHFYLADDASVQAIDPARSDYATAAAEFPAPKYVPQDYIPPEGPPSRTAVARMGLHWNDGSVPLVPHHFDFTEAFLNGSWNGEYTFMEPMATRDFLLARRGAEGRIKQPAAYQRTGYFPTHYTIRFDEPTHEYVFSLEDMVYRRAS